MSHAIKIDNRPVGDGAPCFLIAEIGSNHNQDYSLALKHIDAAADAGVDAVKFQTFKASTHISKYAESPSYLEKKDLHGLIRSLELDRSWQADLKKHSEERGVVFLSSPCDHEAVAELAALGMAANKVASFDMPDQDLVRTIALTGKPVILSTGLADWMEIQRAVDVCRSAGNNDIVLLQCTSIYPAPVNLSNLRAMGSMRQAFNTLTGYSDHTLGDNVACAAVAMGACMIEKHFTLDRTLPGPDHSFACQPEELREMVRKIRELEAAFGDGAKNGPRPEEQEMADKARRSIHAAVDIKAGDVIRREMLVNKRPGHGISTHLRDQVIGRTARRDIKADAWLTWDAI
jgi:sialic acid synthase SpsE